MATIQSVDKALKILNFVLVQNFTHGIPQHRIATGLHLSPSIVSRYVEELKRNELVEIVPESGHVRPSHRLARTAVTILSHISHAKERLDHSLARITAPIPEIHA
ncbi:MAG: transcriptional regulator [Magnetococcales bacterium]|nr:transcriptional regulator [Magnetococcales bacterium]